MNKTISNQSFESLLIFSDGSRILKEEGGGGGGEQLISCCPSDAFWCVLEPHVLLVAYSQFSVKRGCGLVAEPV